MNNYKKGNDDILSLVDKYSQWFKNELRVSKLPESEYTVIHTPFLDSNNDLISIYASKTGKKISLSDDKNTSFLLEISNVKITGKRKEQLNQILRKYRVDYINNELTKVTDQENFSRDIHSLLSAIIDVGSLYLTSHDRVTSFFKEDVLQYLNDNKIFYSQNIGVQGTSNFTHNFDLLFQQSETNPERFADIIDNPSKSKIADILFSWTDILPYRDGDPRLVVIINNQDKEIDYRLIDALESYNALPILWEEKDNKIEIFK